MRCSGDGRDPVSGPTSGEHEIVNPLGLHARAVGKLVTLANEYSAAVWVSQDGREVNGKSSLSVLTLGAAHGSVIGLRCEGEDAVDAYAALAALVNDGFGEL